MIPRVIHLVWVGERVNPFPDYLDRWRQLHPGWDVRVWTDATRPHLGDLEEIYQRIPHTSGKVNLLRLWLLAEFGGVYTDMDSSPLAPIDHLVDGVRLATMTGRNGHVHNGTMAATQHHPAMVELVERAPAHYARLRQRGRVPIWEVYGTRYLRTVLPNYSDLYQWPRQVVCRRVFLSGETVVAHTNLNSWRGQTTKRKVTLP